MTNHLLFLTEHPPYRVDQVDETGKLLQSTHYQQLDEIALQESDALLVAIPGELCIATQAQLAEAPRSTWKKVIPYQLEDQLIDNVSDYFFAMGEQSETGHVPVIAINKGALESIQGQLEEADLRPRAIIPDFLVLPSDKNTLFLLSRDKHIIARTSDTSGFTTDAESLHQIINLIEPTPKQVKVLGDTKLDVKLTIPTTNIPLHYQLDTPINLLQGKHRLKKRRTQMQPRWRLALYSISVVILSLFASYCLQYFYFNHLNEQLKARSTTVYQQLFPNQSMPSNPKSRVEALLNHLVKVVGSNNLMRMLRRVGVMLKHNRRIRLLSINYTQPNLQLRIHARRTRTINRFILALTKTGLKVQQTQKTIKHHIVTVTLTINEGK